MARSRQRDRGARGGRGASGASGGGLGSQEAVIYLATGVTLVVAAVIILVGLYVTRYRPPRAHVLAVADERYNASDVVARGAYLVTYQSASSSADRFAQDTVEVLVNEVIFRLRGPVLIGEVTDEDVENEIRLQLGFPSLAPLTGGADEGDDESSGEAGPTATSTASAEGAAEATATATATATAEAVATPAPTPDDRAEFADAYQEFLQVTQLSRDEFEQVIRADVIEQRLQDHFGEGVGESGPQKRLSRIRVSDPALAGSIHEQLVDGADFAALHAEHSSGEEQGEGGDLGWAPIEALPDDIAEAVRDLEAGQLSDVVMSGLSYDIFLVTEVSDDQPYDADTRAALIDREIEQWLDEEKAQVAVERDLSDGEARWINERILSRAQDIIAAVSG